jgi:hypothetical protein
MGFTVYHEGGTKDAEFEAYARLLRQRGADLGKLPRVPEPATNRRWLYVWNTREEAEAFARELKKRTGDRAWSVLELNAPISEGPLGPILIQLTRRGDGLSFTLHPLSLALIRSAFPQVGPTTRTFIDTELWYDFLRTRGDLAELTRQIAPGLTGLQLEQLERLGYAVVDDDTDETLVYSPPAMSAAS